MPTVASVASCVQQVTKRLGIERDGRDASDSSSHPSGTVRITDFPSLALIEENDMPVDDRTRLDLHRKLEEALGAKEADTLMAHLPPVTWNDVATKDDLDTLATTLRAEMHALRSELRADFVEATNRQIKWLVTFAAAWSSLLVTVVAVLP